MPRQSKTVETLRKIALTYPETEESVVCDKSAYKARNKGFLFVGSDEKTYNFMLKLKDSLPEASKLAAKEPAAYRVGSTNWVTVTLTHNQGPPAGVVERWIDESFRLLAPKQLVALLPKPGDS